MLNIKKHCLGYRNYRNNLCQYQNALQPVFDKMFTGIMSKLTLKYHICPQLTPILQEIIREQEQGIKEIKALLCECPDKD